MDNLIYKKLSIIIKKELLECLNNEFIKEGNYGGNKYGIK